MRIRPLHKFDDRRGFLFEAFRVIDHDVKMAYIVSTNAGYGRDIDRWHVHHNKEETFIAICGIMKLAVRELDGNITVFDLNWSDPVAVTVERGEGHSLYNASNKRAAVLVLCDNYYDPGDEGRERADDIWLMAK